MARSVKESISQIEAERRAEAARVEAIRVREEENARIRAQNARIEAQRESERERLRAERTKTVFRKSGVLEGLEEVKKDLLGGVRKKDLVSKSEEGRIELVWGSSYKIDKGRIGPERGFLGMGEEKKDYSSIEAVLLSDGRIKIGDKICQADNPGEVKRAIAESYLNPKRVKTDSSSRGSSSSSSSNSECCCPG